MSAIISNKRRRGLPPGDGDGAESESEVSSPIAEAPALPQPVVLGGRFEDDYELGDQLGRGTFSIVRRCIHRKSGVARAVKIIDTRRFRLAPSFRTVSVLDEVRILQSLQHPKIIRIFEVYSHALDGHDAIFIVTELASGGELFDSIIKKGNFSEPQARHVMWQVLSALDYMHGKGVIHRDLKPENVSLVAYGRAV
jgi:serine/threonine protein kinase